LNLTIFEIIFWGSDTKTLLNVNEIFLLRFGANHELRNKLNLKAPIV